MTNEIFWDLKKNRVIINLPEEVLIALKKDQKSRSGKHGWWFQIKHPFLKEPISWVHFFLTKSHLDIIKKIVKEEKKKDESFEECMLRLDMIGNRSRKK